MGKKNNGNVFEGSNITFSNGQEVVSINQGPSGEIQVFGFTRDDQTPLAVEVVSTLKEKGIIDKKD